jgi:hypothetical protein
VTGAVEAALSGSVLNSRDEAIFTQRNERAGRGVSAHPEKPGELSDSQRRDQRAIWFAFGSQREHLQR